MISLKNKTLLPVVRDSGFRMEGYYVWCGSCIKEKDGCYYLFASRWPTETTFPSGYMTSSEIVLASTDSLDKPFVFEKVILSKRDTKYWDGMMAHNPQIHKVGNRYVLFYIGTPDGKPKTRRIGYAWADDIHGEWHRSENPIELPENANNPAVVFACDGSVYMAFRDGSLKVSIAYAESYDLPFKVIAYDIFPKGRIEDMYMFAGEKGLEILAEDNAGAYTGHIGAGVHFCSADCKKWEMCEPSQIYGREIVYDNGEKITLQRRERPQLFADGNDLYLFTTAKTDGPDRESGGKTWNMVQKLI